jgi:hypothetical protein
MFQLRVNEADIKRLEKLIGDIPRAMPRVMSRGLNRTANSARTQTGRELAKITKLKVGQVRKSVNIVKATYSKWRSAVKISERRIPLTYFKAKQTKKGVTYKSLKGRVLIKHAFIETMPSGHTGVFLRVAKDRLPIKEQFSKSLMQVYSDSQSVANKIYAESSQKLAKNIHDQVELILAKRRAG